MSRILANIGLVLYVLLAGVALWWSLNFFFANIEIRPQFSYRYLAGTGIPFALLLMTVAGRQAVLPRFRLGLVLEVFAAALFLWLGLYSYYFLPQSNFFCAVHLGICLIFALLNYYGYRRELADLDRKAAAAKAVAAA